MPLGYRSGTAGFVVTRYPVVLAQSIFCPRQTQWTRLTGCPVIYDGADVELMLRVPGRRWQRSHKGPSEYILAHLSDDIKRETQLFPRLPKFQPLRLRTPSVTHLHLPHIKATRFSAIPAVTRLTPHPIPTPESRTAQDRPPACSSSSPGISAPQEHTPPVSATDTAMPVPDQAPSTHSHFRFVRTTGQSSAPNPSHTSVLPSCRQGNHPPAIHAGPDLVWMRFRTGTTRPD